MSIDRTENLRVRILTTPNSTRLVNGKLSDYPDNLPESEVFIGVTPSTVDVPVPSWFKPVHAKKRSRVVGTWCCLRSKLALLKYHYANTPDSDLLFLEDDVECIPFFVDYCNTFMSKVPDNWNIIWFGGQHLEVPVEITKDVLKTGLMTKSECVLFKASVIPAVIKVLESGPWKCRHYSDNIISDLRKQYPTYAPIAPFAHQKSGYSYICSMRRTHDKFKSFKYKNINGDYVVASESDFNRYCSFNNDTKFDFNNVAPYVLTLPDSGRLVNGKIQDYPAIPEPDLIYGITDKAIITVPSWFNGLCKRTVKKEYAVYLSHLNALRAHLNNHPDKDCLMLEDDVVFLPDFVEHCTQFMKMVPDNWDIVYFGGRHYYRAKEELPGVLRANTIHGLECTLVRSTAVKTIVDALLNDNSEPRKAVDVSITKLGDTLNIYTPIVPFAAQRSGYSFIRNKRRVFNTDYHRHGYISLTGKIKNMTQKDYDRYADPSKYFYAILGCHSSGSSALAGSLYHLGVDLGERLWGMYGHAPIYGGEDSELSKILEAVLPLPNTYTDYTQKQLLDILTIYLSRRYKRQKGPLAAKYPTLAVFGNVLNDLLDGRLKVIFCDRDINKSIKSLCKRYPDVEEYKIANLQHFIYNSILSLLEKLPEDKKIIVNYEDTCNKPEETIKRVVDFMKINPTEEQLRNAVGYIDIKQKHL